MRTVISPSSLLVKIQRTVSLSSTRMDTCLLSSSIIVLVVTSSLHCILSSTHPLTSLSVTTNGIFDGNTCIVSVSPSINDVLTAPVNGNSVVLSPSGIVCFSIIMVPLGVFSNVQTVSLLVSTVMPVILLLAKSGVPVGALPS